MRAVVVAVVVAAFALTIAARTPSQSRREPLVALGSALYHDASLSPDGAFSTNAIDAVAARLTHDAAYAARFRAAGVPIDRRGIVAALDAYLSST